MWQDGADSIPFVCRDRRRGRGGGLALADGVSWGAMGRSRSDPLPGGSSMILSFLSTLLDCVDADVNVMIFQSHVLDGCVEMELISNCRQKLFALCCAAAVCDLFLIFMRRWEIPRQKRKKEGSFKFFESSKVRL